MVWKMSEHRYIVWIVQHGEGCDYTIGCGRNLYDLEATDKEAAIAEVTTMVKETVQWGKAARYGEITIYEVSDSLEISPGPLYRREELQADLIAQREAEESERALYAKLKEKYGL